MSTISEAALLLQQGRLVAFPTETVYGLGADATNREAVKRIFAVKKRPFTHPLIVHLADRSQVSDYAREIPLEFEQLANQFWPGPLTIILKKQPQVLDEVSGGLDTIGLRIPRHPIAKALLQEFGGAIAAPSANLFTHVSPTTAKGVSDELGDAVDMILDGGQCEVGLESTIVDLSNNDPRILRPGMITYEEIAECLTRKVSRFVTEKNIVAPGMHNIHYAPITRTELLARKELLERIRLQSNKIAIITHDINKIDDEISLTHFALENDPHHYAHNLYLALREADQLGVDCIYIEAVPDDIKWDAIRDRIQKASGKSINE